MRQSTGRNILVIKHGALGDIVQGFDGYASLRAGHRKDHIAVLTSPAFSGFFGMMPWFDEVLVDRRGGLFDIREALRISGILRRRWDRIYDFQSSRRTRRYLNHLVRKDVEIIGRSRRASHPLPSMTGMNNRDRMIETARIGGCSEAVADLSWLFAETAAKKGRTAVLVPGSSHANPQKRWPHGHFARLGRWLVEEGFELVLVGTAVDREQGDAILAALPEADDRIGKTSLPELATLFAGADLVVGGDTGPVFLASCIGVPTLMLMSKHTDPLMSAPFGSRVEWLREDEIDSIVPEKAMEACHALLAR